MKKLLTALALTAVMSGTAFANSCPTHVKKIDAALTTSTASEDCWTGSLRLPPP